MEVAISVLLALVLGGAIYFWGRGVLGLRKSDLIAGPAILVALCIILLVVDGSTMFGLIGTLWAVFGMASLVLSHWAPTVGKFQRRDVAAIGGGAIVAGIFMLTIL
jgi:hypothetical protein